MEKEYDNKEYPYNGVLINGFIMLFINLIAIPAIIVAAFMNLGDEHWLTWALTCVLSITFFVFTSGYFVQQPNQARVMIFFGKYRGTCRVTGFWWVNPFMTSKRISLRIRNMDVPPIKVNDKVGNPVMIGMVLVWKVKDTYRATFDIDSSAESGARIGGSLLTIGSGNTGGSVDTQLAIESFVRIQSDAALREVTGYFAYDNEGNVADETTLRGGSHEIVNLLEEKLNERLSMAGIEVVEARINYLAYAPEIAAVMLRRQQASAIISAREKIVEGAVSMVKMALDQLKAEGVVELDEERKAAMVSNLLVVLCADDPAQPVVNATTPK